jgi:iron(III) transport system substrate-binding protein
MRQFFSLIVFIALALPMASWAQPFKPNSIADLALYSGPDREQMLAAGAKKEGKLVWYTALAGGSYKDLAQAFQTKYGVPVESYRGTS